MVFVVCNVKEFESRGIEWSFNEDVINNESKWLWSRIETRDNFMYIFKKMTCWIEKKYYFGKNYLPVNHKEKNGLVLIIIIHIQFVFALKNANGVL